MKLLLKLESRRCFLVSLKMPALPVCNIALVIIFNLCFVDLIGKPKLPKVQFCPTFIGS